MRSEFNSDGKHPTVDVGFSHARSRRRAWSLNDGMANRLLHHIFSDASLSHSHASMWIITDHAWRHQLSSK
jgi:hypothetical protein